MTGTWPPATRLSDVQLPPYHPDTPEVRKDYLQYYAEISRMDRYIGEVLAELQRSGEADNTLVLFISDNGRPFPRDKTTLYDSGIRTPWIVRWPRQVAAGTTCHNLVSSVDIAATMLDAAGVQIPKSVEGKSFKSMLSNPTTPIRDYVFAEKNWHDYEDFARAVRDTRYKYIRNFYDDLPLTPPADAVRSPTFQVMKQERESGTLKPIHSRTFVAPRPKEEFYDTDRDPHELNNLAESPDHVDALKRMQAALAEWRIRTADKDPSFRTADEFDRVTGKPTAARRRPRWSKRKMVSEGLTAE